VAYETIKEWGDIEGEQHPMLAYAASADPDTMYFHEAMREPDSAEFVKATGEEVQSHTENEVWELVPRSSVPPGTKILPAVWAMKHKRRIATREVYKWKARLNIDGSKQEEGVNYWETFSPVASWAAIRMVLITTLIHGWFTKQIDFVLAYTQADVECQLYMAIPKGFEVQDEGQDQSHAQVSFYCTLPYPVQTLTLYGYPYPHPPSIVCTRGYPRFFGGLGLGLTLSLMESYIQYSMHTGSNNCQQTTAMFTWYSM
jgi:hypothetical protein